MKILLLKRSDIEKLVSFTDIVKVLKKAFIAFYKKSCVMPHRTIININDNYAFYMPSYIAEPESLTIKIVTLYPGNVDKMLPTISALVIYNDPKTGLPKAIMDGGIITILRTAATSVLSALYLARENSRNIGIIGAGVQGEGHLKAFVETMEINRLYVYDLNRSKAEHLVEKAISMGIDAINVTKAKDVVLSSDILILATTATEPVIDGDWIKPGMHIISVGWMGKESRELDTKTIVKSKVVVDSKEAVLAESGDILIPIKEGRFNKNDIYAELGEIISGVKPGREQPDEITLFKSVGLAIEDAATAKLIYETASKKGVGKTFNII